MNCRNRQSARLSGYDYSQPGAYFVTIVAWHNVCLFGDVVDGEMQVNDGRRKIKNCWINLNNRFPIVQPDACIIMPNHFHGIVNIVGAPLVGARLMAAMTSRATTRPRATTRVAPTLGDIIGAFKSLTTVEYMRGVKTADWKPFSLRLWQRNYYEHVIRNDESLCRVREYIANNPARWEFDQENPTK